MVTRLQTLFSAQRELRERQNKAKLVTIGCIEEEKGLVFLKRNELSYPAQVLMKSSTILLSKVTFMNSRRDVGGMIHINLHCHEIYGLLNYTGGSILSRSVSMLHGLFIG